MHCSPTFVRAAHMQSTPLTCVRTPCRTSSVCTAVLHSYMLRVCRHCRCLHSSSAVNIVYLCSCALQNLVGTHCSPTFVHAARLPLTSSTCVRTRCRTSLVHTAVLHSYMLRDCRHCRCLHSSSAVNIVYLCSYALQNLVGTHCCPTFVRTARKQSTPLTCVRTCCRTSLVHTAVLHSYMQRVCRHCRWLHSYVLLICHQHRRPGFVRVAKPHWYPLLS